jgi:hypothetical protein
MPIRKKRKMETEHHVYERVLATESNPSDWRREKEILSRQIRAELLEPSRSKLSPSQQDELLNIATQLADVLIDLPVDWVISDDARKESREKVCDLVAALLIKQGWKEDLVREVIDRIFDIVQDSPFGRFVP